MIFTYFGQIFRTLHLTSSEWSNTVMFLFLQNKGTAEACRVQIFLNTAWMAGSPWCLCWSGGTALNRRVWVLRLLCMDWHPVNLGKPSDFSISVSSFVKWGVWNKYSYVLFAPFTEFRIRCHLRKEKKGLKKKTRTLNSQKNMQRFWFEKFSQFWWPKP